VLVLVRRFFAWALDRDYVAANPALGIKPEQDDREDEDGYHAGWYLTREQQVNVIRLAGADPERHLIAFAMGTGLRLGELLCLHIDDVDLDGPNPRVVVKWGSWDPKGRRFRSPKGRKTRTVPLFGMALDAVREWTAALPAFAKRNPLGLMFPTRRGALRTKAPKVWATVQESFGVCPRIGRRIWWHLLRHTFASSLVAGWWGAPRRMLDEVRTLMGHSSVKVTEKYAHLSDQTVDNIGTEMRAAWSTCHDVVTTAKIPRETLKDTRSSKPPVAGSNPAGRASDIVGDFVVDLCQLRIALGAPHVARRRT
jgi:integrase